jgi:hypothetical protein
MLSDCSGRLKTCRFCRYPFYRSKLPPVSATKADVFFDKVKHEPSYRQNLLIAIGVICVIAYMLIRWLISDPIAICQDGTVSYSQHHSGTCSYHGGVRDWKK